MRPHTCLVMVNSLSTGIYGDLCDPAAKRTFAGLDQLSGSDTLFLSCNFKATLFDASRRWRKTAHTLCPAARRPLLFSEWRSETSFRTPHPTLTVQPGARCSLWWDAPSPRRHGSGGERGRARALSSGAAWLGHELPARWAAALGMLAERSGTQWPSNTQALSNNNTALCAASYSAFSTNTHTHLERMN